MTKQEKEAEVERLHALIAEAKAKPGMLRRLKHHDGKTTMHVSTKSKNILVRTLKERLANVQRITTSD